MHYEVVNSQIGLFITLLPKKLKNNSEPGSTSQKH